MVLRSFPLLALVLALLIPRAATADINPVYLGLGVLKTPGVAFDVVGAAFVRPHLEVFESGSRMHRARKNPWMWSQAAHQSLSAQLVSRSSSQPAWARAEVHSWA